MGRWGKGNKTSGTAGSVNVEAERQLEAEETGIVPSWGTGRRGWGTGITMAAITRLEKVTGIELRADSERRQSLLKICEWRGRRTVTTEKMDDRKPTINKQTMR